VHDIHSQGTTEMHTFGELQVPSKDLFGYDMVNVHDHGSIL